MGKFMLVDGNSLIHRAFHALPLLQNSAGEYTNAIYGFVMMFQRALREIEPSHGAVAFDVSRKTFRTEIYKEYKATRKETPLELRGQFAYVKEIVKAFGFYVIEKEGFEADDIIGTLSCEAAEHGHEVYIVTGDRDAFQLINDNIKVLLTRKGISETELVDKNTLFEKYNLAPNQIADLKALMGDASDNIPGVKGIGEKTALKLLSEYHSLENIYLNTANLVGKLGQKLIENKEMAFVSKQLALIDTNVPLNTKAEDCLIKNVKNNELKSIYQNLGFKSLLKDLPKDVDRIPDEKIMPFKVEEISNIEKLNEVINNSNTIIYIVCSGNPLQIKPDRVLFATPGEVTFLSFRNLQDEFKDVLKTYFESEIKKTFYDSKTAYLTLANEGINLSGNIEDICLMAYLLNPGTGKYSPGDIALDYLKTTITNEEEKVHALALAYPMLKEKIKNLGLLKLYQEVEIPLVPVLAEMERRGIKLNIIELKDLDRIVTKDLELIKNEIYQMAGEEFNINSPKQLGKILFEKLNLPIIKKTKTGYSTDAEVLEELASLHEIVAKILDYRTLSKLKSTYIEGLQKAINPNTGRLHTSLNQTITATGRLSSTEPNLQNIPIRYEVGRQIRKAFVAEDGYVLLAADYSQIELRILAHLSKDENLLDAFRKNQDIHTRTAAEVFGVKTEEVTSEMRRRAKAVNFGIVYGISDFGLARDLRIPRQESKTYITNYFERYQGVKRYLKDIVEKARQDGFVSTILNRKRLLPEILSSNRNIRNFGERTAMNTPIQGSAADIIKVAMINIENNLRQKNFQTKMLLQVHDELIFEVPVSELPAVAKLVKDLMENSCKLEVPLVVDVKTGYDWYNMKHYDGGEDNA